MADSTAYLRAEKWAREVGLPAAFEGKRFEKKRLELGVKTDGSVAFHGFDAVSTDGKIVVAIKSGAGRTRAGKEPTGQLMSAHSEALLLSLVKSGRKILAFTDEDLYARFRRKWDGLLPPGVELLCLPLPAAQRAEVLAARRIASFEVSPHAGKVRARPRDEP